MADHDPSRSRNTVRFALLLLGMVCCSLSQQKHFGSLDPLKYLGSFQVQPSPTQQQSNSEGVVSSRYQMAFRESNGFFRDVPEDQWLLRTQILRNRVLYPADKERPRSFFQFNYNPDFSCGSEDFFGRLGFGGVWLCDPHRISRDNCVVYTVYSNQSHAHYDWYEDKYGMPYEFERSVKKRLPFCEVHVFDHTDQTENITQAGLNATFHRVTLRNRMNVATGEPNKPLRDIMKELGHEQITVLRTDLEGSEWVMLDEEIAEASVSQLSFQIHFLKKERRKWFFSPLLKAGYAIFHKDPVLYANGFIMDFSLLKLSPAVRQNATQP